VRPHGAHGLPLPASGVSPAAGRTGESERQGRSTMTVTAESSREAERVALAGAPEDFQALLARIKRDHDTHQLETLTNLARLDDPQLWRDLLGYLATNTWRGQHMPISRTGITHDIHRLFVQPFGHPTHNRRVAIRQAMHQPSARWRALAATMAAELRDREAVPMAIALLRDPHPEVRIAAARVIQAVPDPAAVDALLHNMEERDYGVRSSAVSAMRAIGRPALQALLRRLIDRPCGSDLKMAAGHALHWLAVGADPMAVRALAEALHSPASGVTVPVAADRLLHSHGEAETMA
jgi:hypothetical protein